MRAALRVVPGTGAAVEPSDQRGRVLDRLAGAPFVGRESELGSLLAAFQESTAGRGQLCLVVGEPGIGKTRLAEEVADRAVQGGALVLWGRCWDEGGSPSYWPWIQIVRACVRRLDAAALAAKLGPAAAYIAQIVPEVREKLSPVPAPPPLDVEQARFRLFDAMASFLGRVADAQPLMLVLDDVHSADHTSLLLLRFIARQLHALPIFVLATYRDTEARPTTAAEHLLEEFTREGQRVRLTGFVRQEVERFIRETTGAAPTARLVRGIAEMTQGNPFFIGEIVRLLVAPDRPRGRGLRPLAELRVPDEVRKVIRRRLEPLGAEARELLSCAAVIGRIFDIALLQRVSAQPLEHLGELLTEAAAADVVSEVAGTLGEYGFAHALVRETLYQDLDPVARAQIHHRVGEILEDRHAQDPGPHLGALAYHFYEGALGSGAEKAVAYQTEAGKRALDVLAYEEAAEHFARSLRALELREGQERRRCELLLLLAEAQEKAGERSGARATLANAAAIARTLESPELLARAVLGMAPTFVSLALSGNTVDAAVVQLLEDALAAIGLEDSPVRARLLGRLAMELYWSDAAPRRAALSQEAVDIARRTGDSLALALALSARHVALWVPENADERLSTARDILHLAEEIGDIETALRGRIWLLTDLLELGDLGAADCAFEECRRDADKLGQPLYLWFSATWQSMRAGLEGRFEDAERLAAEALALGRQIDDPDAVQAFTVQMIALRAGRGLGDLEAATAELLDRSSGAPSWRSVLALIFCDQGLEADARREFERLAANDFADIARNADWLATMFTLAQVCCFLLDHARAATLYDLLLPFATRCVVVRSGLVCLGSVSRALAMLAGTMSRWSEAEAHFETALRANEQLGARPLLALTQFAYAMMLLARSQANDQERALALLEDARTTAVALRMDVLARWIEPLGSFADMVGPAPGRPDSGEPHEEVVQDAPTAGTAVFREEGDCWAVGFDDQLVRVRSAAGFRYIALLLRSPGVSFQAAELIGAAGHSHDQARVPAGAVADEAASFGRVSQGLGDAGESFDRRAAGEYKRRLAELREELEEAQRFNDPERAARYEAEIDFLSKQLVRDLGIGNRTRRAGSHAERARINVTRAIDRTLARLVERVPRLGRYLETTIKTGTFCSYTPDPRFQISWEL